MRRATRDRRTARGLDSLPGHVACGKEHPGDVDFVITHERLSGLKNSLAFLTVILVGMDEGGIAQAANYMSSFPIGAMIGLPAMVSDRGASTCGRIPKNRERVPAATIAHTMIIRMVFFTYRHCCSPSKSSLFTSSSWALEIATSGHGTHSGPGNIAQGGLKLNWGCEALLRTHVFLVLVELVVFRWVEAACVSHHELVVVG